MYAKVLYTVWICSLLWGGCASNGKFFGNSFYHKSPGYKLQTLTDGWEQKEMEGIDLAYWNPNLDSTIAILSQCTGSRKASLKQLTKNLFIGLRGWKILRERNAILRGQKGQETLFFIPFGVKGSMLKVIVIKKGSCVYDLIYFGPSESFEKGLPDFQKIIKSFETIDN